MEEVNKNKIGRPKIYETEEEKHKAQQRAKVNMRQKQIGIVTFATIIRITKYEEEHYI